MPTPYHKRQTPITKRMAEDMLVRNLAPRTIDSYTYQKNHGDSQLSRKNHGNSQLSR